MYESFSEFFGNEVKFHKAENGRFLDKEFVHDVRESKQSLELCRVGANYQNSLAREQFERYWNRLD